MSIKEKLKKLVAGASVVGMTTAFGCGDKKEEAPKEPAPVVKTVEPKVKEKCYLHDSDYQEMCENMGSETRLVDWGSRYGYNTICNIVEKAGVVDTKGARSNEIYYDEHQVHNICKNTNDVIVGDDSVTFKCHVEQNSPCKEKNNKIEGEFKVKVTFANLVPLCQDLADQCEERENCKCGTKKDANGCVSCVEEEPDIYYIKDDIGEMPEDYNDELYASMHRQLREEFYRHDEKYENADDDVFLEGDSYRPASEPEKCSDDKNKYCLTDRNITFKFKVKNMSQAKKECDAQCSKIGAECGYLGDRVNLAEGYNCDITDELYDKCKVKCAKQDSEPTQNRAEFDGHCVCDNGEEPIVEVEQKTKSQVAVKPEHIADERVQEAQKQIEETAKKSELKSMSHAEAAQTAEDICLKNYLGARYKKGVCEIPFSGNINKLEELKNKKHLQNCQMNGIKKGKGTTATVDAVCKGVKARINLKNYQAQKRNGKNR